MFKKLCSISVLLIFFTLFIAGCGRQKLVAPINNTAPVNTALVSTTPPVVANQQYQISIKNFAFNSAVLKIKRGDSVAWVNNDQMPHQIKSASFNSNTLSNGQSFSFTFNDTGSFDYYCAIHPSMIGKIIVE